MEPLSAGGGERRRKGAKRRFLLLPPLLLLFLGRPASGFTFPGGRLGLSTQSRLPRRAVILRSQTRQETATAGPVVRGREEGDGVDGDRRVWTWKENLEVSYVQKGAKGPVVLLVPGFGVGSFHYQRNLDHLAESGHRVFAVDLLGQGRSWPKAMPDREEGLVFSVDTWREQLVTFVTQVIQEPVYIAGNSLGGFLGTGVAALHGDWVKGLILLNATPFWAFLPNRKSLPAWAHTIIPWDGSLPAPDHMHRLGAAYFDTLRNPNTITSMLNAVYANPSAYDDDLVREILAPTEHHLGHATFSSILAAPKPDKTFEQYLDMVQCPILQIYGKEDPWVTPFWGQRIKRQKQDSSCYYELSPVGHCPHHEAPHAVNTLMQEWIREQEVGGQQQQQVVGAGGGGSRVFVESVTGEVVTARLMDGQPRDTVEWLAASLLG